MGNTAWRIRDRATFEELRRSDARARRGPVTVTYAESTTAGMARVAYAVGRRCGNAVERNRIRRRLRAAVAEADTLAPGAYLVSAGPAAGHEAFGELKAQVTTAMSAASGRTNR